MHLTTLPDFVFVLFHTFVPSEVWRTIFFQFEISFMLTLLTSFNLSRPSTLLHKDYNLKFSL